MLQNLASSVGLASKNYGANNPQSINRMSCGTTNSQISWPNGDQGSSGTCSSQEIPQFRWRIDLDEPKQFLNLSVGLNPSDLDSCWRRSPSRLHCCAQQIHGNPLSLIPH
jgi:hypothetical protein